MGILHTEAVDAWVSGSDSVYGRGILLIDLELVAHDFGWFDDDLIEE